MGPPPDLRVIRVASGYRIGRTDEIRWEEKNHSDYDFPGKVWEEYCDRDGDVLEAMAWCVERQKCWTADDPENDPFGTEIKVAYDEFRDYLYRLIHRK